MDNAAERIMKFENVFGGGFLIGLGLWVFAVCAGAEQGSYRPIIASFSVGMVLAWFIVWKRGY